ncbi:SecY-interacting protein [Rheinheimera sp.]|uniref:SecY-interacting protein n=1 Tax=Rheinheimera sp. TaxID=1869214 RepID=UPI003AF5179A
MPSAFLVQYQQFIGAYLQKHPTLWTWADPAQLSPCQIGEVVDEQVRWQPVAQPELQSFSALEQALGLQFPQQLTEFYGSWLGAGLSVQHERGGVELLMAWHQADFERLQQNIVAHVLMKRRLKQRETVFIAATDDDNYLISMLLSSGEIYLERVGAEVSDCLAADLSQFLQQLSF